MTLPVRADASCPGARGRCHIARPAGTTASTAGPKENACPTPAIAPPPTATASPSPSFIRRLPKAELHLHIEGTLEPELLLELGRRNGVDLPCSSAEECRAQYRFSDLQQFLDIYYEGVTVLVAEQDYYDLTAAYVRRVAADGVRRP